MARTQPDPLATQLDRVRRRLFLRRLGCAALWCWVAVPVVAAGVLLVLCRAHLRDEPHSPADFAFLQRLAITGLVVLGGILVAAVVCWLRRPTRLAAALELDRALGLRERLTTCLGLSEAEKASPMGQALADDVRSRTVDVGAVYPLRPSRWAWAVPASLGVFLLAVAYLDPPLTGEAQAESVDTPLDRPEEVARRLRQIAPPKDKPQAKKPDLTEAARDIEAELDRLADQRPATREEARGVLKDVATLEERMRRREKQLAEHAQALREQAREADRLTRKKKPEGPPTRLDQAMQEGDLKAAAAELRRLGRELREEQTDPGRKQSLSRELDELRERLDRINESLAKQKGDLEQDMKDKLDPETRRQLEEALKGLEQERAELEQAGEELGQAGEMLKEDRDSEAAAKLGKAGERLGKLEGDGEQQRMAQLLRRVEGARQELARAVGGQPTPAAGRRPEKTEGETSSEDTRARAERTEGRISGLDQVPGMGLRGPKTPAAMKTVVEQASREAAEALDRQRLSRPDGDTARGYFERLRTPPADRPPPAP